MLGPAQAAEGECGQQKTQLLAKLPAFCPTPDGMAIDADGNLVVACPNYGDPDQPACLVKIDGRGRVTKWVDVPPLAETGRACPMGIAFGRLAVEGSTPEIETTIATIMDRATVTIWLTYIMILVVGFIATTKIV